MRMILGGRLNEALALPTSRRPPTRWPAARHTGARAPHRAPPAHRGHVRTALTLGPAPVEAVAPPVMHRRRRVRGNASANLRAVGRSLGPYACHRARPDRQPLQAPGLRVPVGRDLRRLPLQLRLRPARFADAAQRARGLDPHDGAAARRRRAHRRRHPRPRRRCSRPAATSPTSATRWSTARSASSASARTTSPTRTCARTAAPRAASPRPVRST